VLNLLLAAAIPFQRLVDEPSQTHSFINMQAIAILKADGRRAESAWLDRHLEDFNQGCDSADSNWGSVGHMYDPVTGRGLRGWPSAPQVTADYWTLAMRHAQGGSAAQTAYYLGAAAHVVQDLCVPHHAAARVFAGHAAFESYARRYRHRYAVHAGGIYDLAASAEGWAIANACYAREHYSECITPKLTHLQTHCAISDLLPRAQRTTAGFVAQFLNQAEVA